MNRRRFFNTTAALSASLIPSFSLGAIAPAIADMTIAEIEFWSLSGEREPNEGFLGWIQPNPLYVYDKFGAPRPGEEEKGPQRTGALYMKIIAKNGLEGLYGPVDNDVAVIVNSHLKSFLIGKDALACETIWDQLFRRYRHSRAGLYMMAISAVDNTLWDLRGRYYNAPVYRLLGGPTRDNVEFYASCLGYSVEPELVKKRSLLIKNQGYRYQKWFPPYGSGDGTSGLNKNIELVKVLRETLGEETDLMFDVFNGWDLDYAVNWAREVEQYRVSWLEEPFMTNQLELYEKLARKTTIPIATGEHIYNRWEILDFLKTQSLSVIQSDPEWCGGVSELVKICNLASAYGVRVIPHGHGLHAAMHVIASQSPAVCPYGEYLINIMDPSGFQKHIFEKHPPITSNGRIALSDRPGFGIEWDETKIEKKERLSFS
jgi:L-rhamnonate dehydratase